MIHKLRCLDEEQNVADIFSASTANARFSEEAQEQFVLYDERKRLFNEHVPKLVKKAYAQNTLKLNNRDRISSSAQKIASADRYCKKFDFVATILA